MAKLLGETSRTHKDEFIGRENVEGYDYEHYVTTMTTVNKNGQVSTTRRNSWWYEPYKTEIMSKEEGLDATIDRTILNSAHNPTTSLTCPKITNL